MHWTLLSSPFLGRQSWLPTARSMEVAGYDCTVIDVAPLLAGADPYRRAARTIAASLQPRTMIAVHSGAGSLLAAVLAVAADQPSGVIFVDALLPHPGRSWLDTAPAALRERVQDGARAGAAPSWPALLPGGLLERLVPD